MFGKKKLRLLIWSATISIVAGISACGEQSEKSVIEGFSITGNTQGTTYTIILAEEEIHFTKEEVDSVLAEFDTVLSTYIPQSYISQLNASANQFDFYDPSGFFKQCYEYAREAYDESETSFDPSVFPLMQGWGFFQKMSTPLAAEKVDSIMQFVSFEANRLHSVTFRNDSVLFQKKDPRFMLDFNAIAQGYSVDVICDFIRSKGHKNYYVEIGGELRVSGLNREGSDWRIGIDTPQESNSGSSDRSISGVLHLRDKSVATSGNYRNFYEKDGKKYAHTLDPKTGYPVEHNLLSATVITDNCAMADALATTFMVVGLEKSKALLATTDREIEVVLIYEEGGEMKTYTSSGAQKMLEE